MRKNYTLLFLFFCIHVLIYGQSNDYIFRAAVAARKYIDFDQHGFIINGKKTFLVSAGLEYARIPHQLWRDRLMRLKRAGFNCIEIYTFWNFHEPQEGRFDFSGDHDLDAFLRLVKQMGMYAIARVGPYYCAEWDLGGYPVWLRFKDSLVLRVPNPVFEKYTDRFFDRLIPIIVRNQVSHGGSVILVQLENEHDASWGTFIPNRYFSHLQKKVLSLGLQVPYFFSGLHHGSDPAGNEGKSFDNPYRPNPWFTTEFWSVWYDRYGSGRQDADEYGRRTWKIIERGGGGYNYYMAHGGTNFGYTNNDEMAASYDYGAAVGQAGGLRPIYYQFKRNAWFARSFESILCNAGDACSAANDIIKDVAVHVFSRHSPNGDIVFLDNGSTMPVNLQIGSDSIALSSHEILPLVRDFKLARGVTLDWGLARILGISNQGNTHTLVVYGNAGSKARLKFSADSAIHTTAGDSSFDLQANTAVLKIVFNSEQPAIYRFTSGAETVRIIAVDSVLAGRTWFADANGKQYVIIGPEYLGDVKVKNHHLQLTTEHFWEESKEFPVWVYDEQGVRTAQAGSTPNSHPATRSLGAWETASASAPASSVFDDSRWFKSDTVLQMGADGDLSCYAWYRTRLNINSPGAYVLKLHGGDRASVYLDNVRIGSANIPGSFSIPSLSAGRHVLAIFTAHSGRNKLYSYYGPMKFKDPKGLAGKVVLQQAGHEDSVQLLGWRMKGGPGNATAWNPLKTGASSDRPVFYRNSFTVDSANGNAHAIWRVSIEGLGHGSIWVNGYNLGRYPEKIPVNSLYIPECWLVKGNNSIMIYDEDGKRPDKVSIIAETAASRDISILEL